MWKDKEVFYEMTKECSITNCNIPRTLFYCACANVLNLINYVTQSTQASPSFSFISAWFGYQNIPTASVKFLYYDFVRSHVYLNSTQSDNFKSVLKYQTSRTLCYCCRKTAVCNGDQLLDFFVPELVWSQSTFSSDREVLQNYTGFTLWNSAGLAVGECSAIMSLTP